MNLPLYFHSIGTHVQTTSQPATQATTAKVEKERRPTISSAGSSKEWSYFLTHWKDYVEATKLKGKDMVVKTARMLRGTTSKRPLEERRRFAHQQIRGRGDGSDKKTCRERRKHHGRSCTTSQHASRPG